MLTFGDYTLTSDLGNSFMVGGRGESSRRTYHPTLEAAVAEVRRRLIHDGFQSAMEEMSPGDLRNLLEEVESIVREFDAASAGGVR